MLCFRVPRESVWPSMRTVMVGRDFSTLPISSSSEKLRG